MKALARIGAGLSFTAFFLGGVAILTQTEFRITGEYVLGTALGLFLVGTAFFAGVMLWLAVEKWTMKQQGHALGEPGQQWPWKIILASICAIVAAMVAIYLVRVLGSVFFR